MENYFKYIYIYTDVQCLSSVSEGFSGSLHGGRTSRVSLLWFTFLYPPPPPPPAAPAPALSPLVPEIAHNPLPSQCIPGFVCPVLPLDHRANRLTGRHGLHLWSDLSACGPPSLPPPHIHTHLCGPSSPPPKKKKSRYAPPPPPPPAPHSLSRPVVDWWGVPLVFHPTSRCTSTFNTTPFYNPLGPFYY